MTSASRIQSHRVPMTSTSRTRSHGSSSCLYRLRSADADALSVMSLFAFLLLAPVLDVSVLRLHFFFSCHSAIDFIFFSFRVVLRL